MHAVCFAELPYSHGHEHHTNTTSATKRNRCGADRERQTRHHRAYGVHAVSAFGTSPEFWLNLQRDYDVLRFDAHSVQYVPNLVGARPPMNHEERIHIAG